MESVKLCIEGRPFLATADSVRFGLQREGSGVSKAAKFPGGQVQLTVVRGGLGAREGERSMRDLHQIYPVINSPPLATGEHA